jgi:hypothetical protein
MYTAVIQVEGCEDRNGKPIPPGTIIYNADAWQLCLPAEFNFLGLPPRAEPGDDETRQKVQEEVEARSPAIAAEKTLLQKRLDKLAAKYPDSLNKAGDDFARNGKQELIGSLAKDAVAVHIVTLAQNRGMKPAVPAAEPKK